MRVLIVVLGIICAACAIPRHSRIVGGDPTTIETYPFMAGMLKKWEEIFNLACGGTLISPTSVVSAAHCFEDSIPSLVKVRLGSDKDTSGGIEHIVSRIIVHPKYEPVLLKNDILIMRLREAAVYSDRINSARIPGPRYVLPTNTVVYAIGWGDIQEGGPHSEILRHVAVDVIDQQICTERHASLKNQPDMENWYDVTAEMLCTGILDVGGKDACQGDSGGPVIHNRDVLVGITSWGYKCAHPMYPGVNVRVSNYTEWIYTNSVN